MALGANANTKKKDDGWILQYWKPFCAVYLGGDAFMWRPSTDELAGDPLSIKREACIQAMFILHVHMHIQPRDKDKKMAGQEA